MKTYLFRYRTHGTGEMIAKIEDDLIYDLRGKSSEFLGDVVGKVKGYNLYKPTTTSYECTDIYVDGDIAYKKGLYHKEPFLVAKNSVIYECTSYKQGREVAEYRGNATQALFAYAALINAKSYASSSSGYSNNTTKPKSNTNSGSGGSAGGGLATVFAFAVLFLFGAALSLTMDYYPYYPLVHIALPGIVLLGIILKRGICREVYEYNLANMFWGALGGAAIGIFVIFCYAFVDMGVQRYLSFGRKLIITTDTSYTIAYVTIILISVLLSLDRKK